MENKYFSASVKPAHLVVEDWMVAILLAGGPDAVSFLLASRASSQSQRRMSFQKSEVNFHVPQSSSADIPR